MLGVRCVDTSPGLDQRSPAVTRIHGSSSHDADDCSLNSDDDMENNGINTESFSFAEMFCNDDDA